MKRLITLMLSAMILTGCGPGVKTNKTVYYSTQHAERGLIYVAAFSNQQNSSLEFTHYKRKIETYLQAVGFIPTQDKGHAEFTALVSYGIGDRVTTSDSVPIYGQTGGGITQHSGSFNSFGGGYGTFSGTSHTMPTFGVVGSIPVSNTTYTRQIAIDIVRTSTLATDRPEKLFEIRGKSSGSCSVISEVFDEMLEAMFTDFPGENGKSKRVEVKSEANC